MRRTRWTSVFVGLFVVSLVLAACGGDDDAGGGPTGAASALPLEASTISAAALTTLFGTNI